jgi:hypothetical protein
VIGRREFITLLGYLRADLHLADPFQRSDNGTACIRTIMRISYPKLFERRLCKFDKWPADLAGDRVCCVSSDVAPNFYPAAIGVWRSVIPSWAVMAAVRGAEPSVERSAADRRAAA